ncbi:MAG TPA: YdcF family protein [Chloroflexota bacterium]|nr:YdcF family protein [Chloroflexota bacterium]
MKSLVRGCAVACLLGIVAIVVGGFLAYRERDGWLPVIGRALAINSQVQHADVIVVLGGGDGDRARYAATLYHQGLADHLITTGSPVGSDAGAVALTNEGVPRDAIVLANGTQSTREDAEETRKLIQSHGWKTALLVTDPYHIRRAFWTFRTAFEGDEVEIYPAPVVGGWFDADHWWQSENGFAVVDEEYLKLVYYLAHGYIHPSVMLDG